MRSRAGHWMLAQVVLAGSVLTGPHYAMAAPATGPLRVHPDNPRYFTDGSGKAIYLTGSHIGWELQDHGWGRDLVFDYRAFLDMLEAHNHNFFRLWVVEHTRWASSTTPWATPMPYARTGPGQALDGGLKFDLTQFDQAYFDRLRSRVIAARDRGIYAAVMLFQGWSIESKDGRTDNPWAAHPFNAGNNVNGIDGDLDGDGEGKEVHTLHNRAVTALQEAYVRQVVDAVNDLGNVLYEIANESGPYSTAWQYHMINFVKRYEATKPKQHPVGMTAQSRGATNQALFDSPADWISPRREGGYRDDPPAADGSKVIIVDTDHLWGVNGPKTGEWVWKCLCRGLNPIYMDSYTNQEALTIIENQQFDPAREPIRRAMGHARAYADRMNLAAMVPRNDLASSSYCLANPGREYLVYLPTGGEVTVDLSDAAGTLSVEWSDPRRGTAADRGAVEGG
ncbi:MAG: DUF6298 domain-containing protein, partial [Armatimonadota bacterium]